MLFVFRKIKSIPRQKQMLMELQLKVYIKEPTATKVSTAISRDIFLIL